MRYLILSFFLALPTLCLAKSPACSSWPMNMALVHLKNAAITDPTKLDESQTRAVLLASEKIGKDLYRQIYDITFYEKSGNLIEVITNSQASSEECSMSGVDVYIVSMKIDGGR